MSNVPKSKRKDSHLEVIHIGVRVQRKIHKLMFYSFHLHPKLISRHANMLLKNLPNVDKEEFKQRLLDAEGVYVDFIIELYRKRIIDNIARVLDYLITIDEIRLNSYPEYMQRKINLTKAVAECRKMQYNFQFLVDLLFLDANKFGDIVLDLDELENKIRALRRSDTERFKKKIKLVENTINRDDLKNMLLETIAETTDNF